MDERVKALSKINNHSVKFVTSIEKKVRRDLEKIKKNHSELLSQKQIYNDNVLRVYREAFDTLLNNISTFKPILLEIRDAYESSLCLRDKQLKMNMTLLGITTKEKERINITTENISYENVFLKQKIQEMENEIEDFQTKLKKLEKEALSDNLALCIERDARHALSFENIRLKNEISRANNNEEQNKKQDPVILNVALQQCRKDLSKITKQYNIMREEYTNTVSRKEYESMELKYYSKMEALECVNLELNELKRKHDSLADEYEKIKEEIIELKDKYSELEQTGTPRPMWDICGEFIGGGSTRWKTLTKQLTSKEKLYIILKELGPKSERINVEHFEGLGFDPIVPKYLQYSGQVRNLRLSRRDISILLNDIWNAKSVDGIGVSMQDFLHYYFYERYQEPSIRVEWAYNLYYSCEQMLDDQYIKLFWGVLHGKLSEDIYYTHRSAWNKFKDSIICDSNSTQKFLLIKEVETILRKVFPLKSEIEIRSILEIMKRQLKIKPGVQEMEVSKLFIDNGEGLDRIDLAKELYRQQQQSQEKYIKEILIQLGGKKNGNIPISVDNLKRAFVMLDPHIDHITLESNIRWAFSNKTSDLSTICPLTLRTIANKLNSGNIQRVGPQNFKSIHKAK